MSWITTANGHELDLHYPRPAAIVLADIAHALAQVPRFAGHCRRPYSVAEHSLLVLDIVQRLFSSGNVHAQMAALMHDAHEAYTGHHSTLRPPLQVDALAAQEERLATTVRSAFGLHTASCTHATVIRKADLIAEATERAQLLPPATPRPALTHVQPAEWVDLMDHSRCTATWQDWRQRFTDHADALDFGRNAAVFGHQPKARP